jgi:hypothetical protein
MLRGRRFLNHTPTPFSLKVPYVSRLFTSSFQVFRFLPFQTMASTVSITMRSAVFRC